MPELGTLALVTAGLYALPALVWGAVTAQCWDYWLTRRPRTALFRMLPVATGLATVHCFLGVVGALVPVSAAGDPVRLALVLGALRDASALASVAVFRHLLCYMPARAEPPGARWLGVHYGLTLAVAAVSVAPPVLYGVAMVGAASVTFWLYVLAMSGLCLGEVARLARGKGFGPAGLAQMRRPDVVVIAAGLVVSV